MGMVEKQNSDESYGGYRTRDGQEMWRSGSNTGPAGSNTPSYLGGAVLSFNIAGGTDTGGGLLGWTNNLGYDIIVTSHQLDVTTVATAACSVEFGGTSTNVTTASTNMIASQDVHSATGQFNGGALSVKVPNGKFITGSTLSGASAGLVARAYFSFIPAAAAGGI